MFFNISDHRTGCIAAGALVTTLLGTGAVGAQTASAAGTGVLPSDPKDPPKVAYQSALGGYQRYANQPVAPWVATNARVAQAGGWRAYAKQAQEPDVPTDAQPKEKP